MYIVKQCPKCKEYKLLDEYHSDKRRAFGKRPKCKSCDKQYYQENKERIKQYREENKERILKYVRHFYQENKGSKKQYAKQYREENKERINLKNKQYREENKERIKQWREENKEHAKQYYQENKERIKQYYQENKERITQKAKQYRQENKGSKKQYAKQWREENKERIKQYIEENKERINKYHNKRKQTDPLYKMRCNIRSLIANSMKNKGYTKSSRTYQILGCDFETFKKHIERQFTKGMNWNNHGKWHYDHIIPISSAQTEEEVIKLNHYTNFQPLWAEDNIRKSNNIEPTQIKMRM
jgi:transposase-like protein